MAANQIEQIYKTDFDVEIKFGDEPVTIADKQADSLITGHLKQFFPHDRILSEENGLYLPATPSARVWFVDPIDGTKEFIAKNGEFAIQIGMADAGVLEFGLVYQPVGQNLYVAATGCGCWWHSPATGWQKLEASTGQQNLTVAVSRSHISDLSQKVCHEINAQTIAHGSVGLKLMLMAKNQAQVYVNDSNNTKAWDIAAPQVLFSEAGGVVSDLRGANFDYDPTNYHHEHGLIACNSKELHQQVLQIIKE